MGRRGPPPQPTRLKIVKGNPGKRPLPENEAAPELAVPDCPEHISPVAALEWTRISAELHAHGLLTRLDRAALSAYCQAWARWVDAEALLAKHGLIVKSPNGVLMQSPMLAIANRSMKQMKEFLTEFGMTPSSRSRITIEGHKKVTDPADAFFKTG